VANAANFESVLAKAEKRLGDFGSKAGNLLTSPVRLPANAFGAINRIGQKTLAPVKELASAAPFIGGALGSIPTSGAGFLAWIDKSMQGMKESAKAADKLGLSTEAMAGLTAAAGGNIEGVAHAVLHMENTIGEAVEGSKALKARFKDMGLDEVALAVAPPEKALGQIIDKINQLPTAAERTRAGMAIFGRGFLGLPAAILKGSESIEGFQKRAEKHGLGVGRDQIADMMRLGRATAQVQEIIDGTANQVSARLAPAFA